MEQEESAEGAAFVHCDNPVIVRPEATADQEAVHEVHRLAFASDVEPQLVDALRKAGEAVISLVAECEGDIVGHVLFSRLAAPMPALALAPVAVVPDRQRQGVGSLLIREGLRQAQQGGWVAVFVVGEPTYYARFGFDANQARGYACPYAGEYFMVRFIAEPQPLTGDIVYPAAFADLE
jgi:putative acetyltransferase